eukprot:1735106-Rhodomonas_salina.1
MVDFGIWGETPPQWHYQKRNPISRGCLPGTTTTTGSRTSSGGTSFAVCRRLGTRVPGTRAPTTEGAELRFLVNTLPRFILTAEWRGGRRSQLMYRATRRDRAEEARRAAAAAAAAVVLGTGGDEG